MAYNSTNSTVYNQDWNDVLTHIDPYAFANVGAALALTMCVIGAAWCASRHGGGGRRWAARYRCSG